MSSKKKKKLQESGPAGTKTETLAPETAAAPTEPAPTADEPAPPSTEDQLRDQLLRLQADFDNFRRRTQRERSELYQRANEDLIGELLPVLDHFELGFENAVEHEANPDVVAGFRMVFDQALATLGKFGLQPVEAVGAPFDPHHHEAVTQMPSQEFPEDIVVIQTRRGYMLADKLLRAAQVVVSAGPGPQTEPLPAADPAGDEPAATEDQA